MRSSDGSTHIADSITVNDRVIMRMIVGGWDLQLNVDFEPPGILHISEVLSLTELKVLICEQKNLLTDVAGE
jgi:hypothetical protein